MRDERNKREREREGGGQEKRKEGEINLRQRDRRLINRDGMQKTAYAKINACTLSMCY